MKKRLLILGMIFTMAVSSAGCGSSSSDNEFILLIEIKHLAHLSL